MFDITATGGPLATRYDIFNSADCGVIFDQALAEGLSPRPHKNQPAVTIPAEG